ncbi:MAG: zinc ABC transporter substrate-binding protein [Saprospiraceae bacterium]|nr:zinc ABC transporter substrate-binding protein [Saprospiraceae bacterium]
MNIILRAASFLVFTLTCSPFLYAQSSVVCTNSILADIAHNIGGEEVTVLSIVPVGSDPHIYEPVPGNIQQIRNADLIILNGLNLENWLNKIIVNSGFNGISVIAADGIKDVITAPEFKSYDPHAWMNPIHGIQYARNICDGLIQLLPEKAEFFERNFAIYKRQLELLDEEIHQKFSFLSDSQRILITSHDAFRYFGYRYHLEVEPLMGISTEADLQVSDIRRISELLTNSKVKAIFVETTINPKLMQQLSHDFGVLLAAPLFADSLGDENTEAGTYIGMLSYNANTISAALSGEDTGSGAMINASFTEKSLFISVSILISFMGILFLGMVRLLNHGL